MSLGARQRTTGLILVGTVCAVGRPFSGTIEVAAVPCDARHGPPT